MLKRILELLGTIWNMLKKIFLAIVNFLKNIVSWFKNKYNQLIKKYPKVKPLALKIEKNLKDGNYNTLDIGLTKDNVIIKTFYNEETGEIIEDYTEVIEYDKLDEDTKNRFGDKDMIVIK